MEVYKLNKDFWWNNNTYNRLWMSQCLLNRIRITLTCMYGKKTSIIAENVLLLWFDTFVNSLFEGHCQFNSVIEFWDSSKPWITLIDYIEFLYFRKSIDSKPFLVSNMEPRYEKIKMTNRVLCSSHVWTYWWNNSIINCTNYDFDSGS